MAPRSFIGTGIVPDPLLMIFRIIRNSFPINKRFPSIVLIFYIQVRIRENPADFGQLFKFIGELFRYKSAKSKVMTS